MIGISIPIRSPVGVFGSYLAMDSEIFAGVLLLDVVRVFAWKLGLGFLEALDKEGVEFADSLGLIGGKIPCLPKVLLQIIELKRAAPELDELMIALPNDAVWARGMPIVRKMPEEFVPIELGDSPGLKVSHQGEPVDGPVTRELGSRCFHDRGEDVD
mgnify:CR=1 FL=1